MTSIAATFSFSFFFPFMRLLNLFCSLLLVLKLQYISDAVAEHDQNRDTENGCEPGESFHRDGCTSFFSKVDLIDMFDNVGNVATLMAVMSSSKTCQRMRSAKIN